MNLFYWFSYYVVKLLFFIFYRHRVIGLENVPPGAAIIAPNHVSFLDPPLIAISMTEQVFFLARDTLFHSWILGLLLRGLNTYPVSGSASDLASFKTVCKLLNEGKKVTIFPEGVRSPDGELLPLQSGVAMLAFRCHRPVIPVYIKGAFDIYSRHRRFPKPWGKTLCIFGKPIYPETYAHLEKKAAQQAMTQELSQALAELAN